MSLSLSQQHRCVLFFFFNPGKSKGGPLLTEDLSPFYIDRIRPVYILMIFSPLFIRGVLVLYIEDDRILYLLRSEADPHRW